MGASPAGSWSDASSSPEAQYRSIYDVGMLSDLLLPFGTFREDHQLIDRIIHHGDIFGVSLRKGDLLLTFNFIKSLEIRKFGCVAVNANYGS